MCVTNMNKRRNFGDGIHLNEWHRPSNVSKIFIQWTSTQDIDVDKWVSTLIWARLFHWHFKMNSALFLREKSTGSIQDIDYMTTFQKCPFVVGAVFVYTFWLEVVGFWCLVNLEFVWIISFSANWIKNHVWLTAFGQNIIFAFSWHF